MNNQSIDISVVGDSTVTLPKFFAKPLKNGKYKLVYPKTDAEKAKMFMIQTKPVPHILVNNVMQHILLTNFSVADRAILHPHFQNVAHHVAAATPIHQIQMEPEVPRPPRAPRIPRVVHPPPLNNQAILQQANVLRDAAAVRLGRFARRRAPVAAAAAHPLAEHIHIPPDEPPPEPLPLALVQPPKISKAARDANRKRARDRTQAKAQSLLQQPPPPFSRWGAEPPPIRRSKVMEPSQVQLPPAQELPGYYKQGVAAMVIANKLGRVVRKKNLKRWKEAHDAQQYIDQLPPEIEPQLPSPQLMNIFEPNDDDDDNEPIRQPNPPKISKAAREANRKRARDRTEAKRNAVAHPPQPVEIEYEWDPNEVEPRVEKQKRGRKVQAIPEEFKQIIKDNYRTLLLPKSRGEKPPKNPVLTEQINKIRNLKESKAYIASDEFRIYKESLGQVAAPKVISAGRPKKIQGGSLVDYGKAIMYGRTDYPPKVRDIIEEYGSQQITKIQIGRTPLPSITQTIVNVITLGAFKKALESKPYDDLYHLFLLLTFHSGNSVLVEKNEVINMIVGSSVPPRTTMIDLDAALPIGTTLQIFMNNTKDQMGPSFFPYSLQSNNCQDFCVAMLQANKVYTATAKNFIKQDFGTLFNDYKRTSGVIDAITNVAATVDVIKQGAGIKSQSNNITKKMPVQKFVKGSQEAKDHMAKIRGMRKGGPRKSKEGMGLEGLSGDSVIGAGVRRRHLPKPRRMEPEPESDSDIGGDREGEDIDGAEGGACGSGLGAGMGAGVHIHHHHYYGGVEGGNIRSFFKNVGRSAKHFVTNDLPTALIHKALPSALTALGTAAGSAAAIASGNPELAPIGAKLGSTVGAAAGKYAAKEIGKVAGRGMRLGKGGKGRKPTSDWIAQQQLGQGLGP